MPKISIIVPVYKVEEYLERCINSILSQTFSDYELILVNDGSPDNCGSMCDNFAEKDSRIIVIHKENGGLSSARNAGIAVANGQYIGFVDSDDWVSHDMFEYLVHLIEQYDCDIASVSYILSKGNENLKQDNIEIKVFENTRESLNFYLREGMSKRIGDYPVWIKLYKKSLFKDIRFPEGQLYEDVATNFMLLQKAKRYVKSNKVCYFYFQDGKSITRGKFREKDFDMLLVGNQLIELSNTLGYEELIHLSKMKKARSYLSLLMKIAIYGFENNTLDKSKIIKDLTRNLRDNYFLLMKSPMPLSRKIVLNILCINIRLLNIPISILRIIIK